MEDVQQLIESVERKKQKLLQEAQERKRKTEEKKKKEKKKNESKPPPEKKAKTKLRKKKEKAPVGRARKIRLYPTNEERQKLARWFGAARWTYNRCLEEVRDRECERTEKALRARTVNEEVLNNDEALAWLKEVPYDIRDEGLRDLLKAYKSNFARQANDPNHVFEMRFRSRKRLDSETITVHSKHWKKKKGVYAWLRAIHSSEPKPDILQYDARLQRTKAGAYYLCVPLPLVIRDENQVPKQRQVSAVVALDPGVRTFQTCYDPTNQRCLKWGDNDVKRVYRLCYALDDLVSRCSQQKRTIPHRRRWKMRCAAARIRTKIRNLIDDVQRKLIKWLCENHHLVLLPAFETSRMIGKRDGRRRINSKTARAMATWAHYRFRMRLLSKAHEYPRCHIEIVDEAYTSKTCGRCGTLHHKLGGAKLFQCPQCSLRIDRDLNGARNIYLRYLTTTTNTTTTISAGPTTHRSSDVSLAPALRPTSATTSSSGCSAEPLCTNVRK
jgi:putative transposase